MVAETNQPPPLKQSSVQNWIRGDHLARLQDLIMPTLGMYAGQYLLGALPRTPGWGWGALGMSMGLLILRLRPIKRFPVADILQIVLGVLLELPLALNVDSWKDNTPTWQLIALWLLCCIMIGLAAVRQMPHHIKLGLNPVQRADRIDVLVVVMLIATSLLVRVPNLETVPSRVDVDEPTWARLAIESVSGGANDPFATGWSTHPTLQFFVHGELIKILGRTFLAMRLPSAVVGTLAVLALYLLARTVYPRRVAVISAFLMVASDTAIHFSRLGVNNVTDILFFGLVIGLFWTAGASGRPVFFVLTGAGLGLALYYYFGNRAIPFIVGANLLVWLLADRQGVRRAWLLILTVGLMSIVVAMPLLGNWLRIPSSFTEHLNVTIPFSSQLQLEASEAHVSLLRALFQRITASLLVFTYTPDQGGFYNSGQSLLHPIEVPFFLIGLMAMVAQWRRPINQGVLLWMAVVLTLGSVLVTLVATFHRILGVLPAGILVVAIGIDVSADALMQYAGLSQQTATRFAAGALMIIAAVDLHYYFLIYNARPPIQAPDEQALNIAALEYEHLGGNGQFILYMNQGFDENGLPYSPPIRYVAGDAFHGDISEFGDAFNASQPIYFYVLPNRASELPAVMARFPNGSTKEYRRQSDGLVLLTRYVVPSTAPVAR